MRSSEKVSGFQKTDSSSDSEGHEELIPLMVSRHRGKRSASPGMRRKERQGGKTRTAGDILEKGCSWG